MKSQLATCLAILATAFNASAQIEKTPELQVLDNFVGTWDIKVTVKPAAGEEITSDAVSHRRWSIGGKYVLVDDPGTEGNERHMALTYDPETKTYPGVQITGPRKGAVTGTWSAESKTMTYLIEYLDGSKYEGTHRFVSPGHADASGKITRPDGAVIVELSWKQTRRKPLGKEPTVEALIASYHKSIGGFEVNKKITTRRREGTFSQFDSPPMKITVIQKAPDLGLTKIEIDGFGEARDGTDGKVVWKSNPAEGTVELQGAERVQKIRDYQFQRHLDLKSDFKTLTSKGRETVTGTTYDVLEAVREDGSSEMLFFHARTHHLSLVKLADFTVKMTNYRESSGIFYPGTISVTMPGGRTVMTGNFTKIEHGIKVDDAIFKKPKE